MSMLNYTEIVENAALCSVIFLTVGQNNYGNKIPFMQHEFKQAT